MRSVKRSGVRGAVWLGLICLVAACKKPVPEKGALVTVTLGEGLKSKCLVLKVIEAGHGLRSDPTLIADGRSFGFGIAQGDLPDSVKVQAIGYEDEKCSSPTAPPEETALASITFAVPVSKYTLPLEAIAGTNNDNDGSYTPADCDDNNADVYPGAPERCFDHVDNDCDQVTDCAQTSCAEAACVEGTPTGLAKCLGGACIEVDCGNNLDDNLTGGTDCADPTCNTKACPFGGHCAAGVCTGQTHETACADGQDNDNDLLVDCADSDCSGLSCDDGIACTNDEKCTGSTCVGSMGSACGAGTLLCHQTMGSCDVSGNCQYANVSNGTPCDDALACNGSDTCNNGQCTHGGFSCPPSTSVCRNAGLCVDPNGTCTYAIADGSPCDAGTCSDLGVCVPPTVVPSNVEFGQATAGTDALFVDAGCVLRIFTDNIDNYDVKENNCHIALPSTHEKVDQNINNYEIMLISASSIVVAPGGLLHFFGNHPVALASKTDIDVQGTISVGPGEEPAGRWRSGAGGNSGNTSTDGTPPDGPGVAGGAGATFGSVGGNGGRGGDTDAGTSPITDLKGTPSLVPLRGGCGGGKGGNGGSEQGNSSLNLGRAGGAIQLIAQGTITVSGIVTAPGQGGYSSTNGDVKGGGGGGSGGGILLEARKVKLTAAAALTANGGAGGAGSISGEVGGPGSSGAVDSAVPAMGGVSVSNIGGAGGFGATATNPAGPGNGSANYLNRNNGGGGGGGGGGGFGRIRINATAECSFTSGAVISPGATYGNTNPDSKCHN